MPLTVNENISWIDSNTYEELLQLYMKCFETNNNKLLIPMYHLFNKYLNLFPKNNIRVPRSGLITQNFHFQYPVPFTDKPYVINFNIQRISDLYKDGFCLSTICKVKDIKDKLILCNDHMKGLSTDMSSIFAVPFINGRSESLTGYIVIDGNHRLSQQLDRPDFDNIDIIIIDPTSLAPDCFSDLYSYFVYSFLFCLFFMDLVKMDKEKISIYLQQYARIFDKLLKMIEQTHNF